MLIALQGTVHQAGSKKHARYSCASLDCLCAGNKLCLFGPREMLGLYVPDLDPVRAKRG